MSVSFLYPEALWLLLLIPLTLIAGWVGPRRLPPVRHWASLLLRVLILLLVILGLAGAQLVRTVDELTTVFVVDVSDSVAPEEQARAEAFIRDALRSMPSGDRAAVVVFGEEALVERLPSDDRWLIWLESVPGRRHTDIAAALRLAMALFPEDTEKRIVLLSDGQENRGHARREAELAAARGIEIAVVPLSPPAGAAEVLLSALNAPASVRIGQRFDLTTAIESTVATTARLRLFSDQRLLDEREVSLQPGTNRFAVPVTAEAQGFHRYQAIVEAADDTRPQNNQAAAFTIVHGPPRVLVVAQTAADADPLVAALQAAHLNPTRATPEALPTDLTELASYDAIVLVNVPVRALPKGGMEVLRAFVRHLGHGLVMVGGEASYGAGGYLRTPVEEALPVSMEVRSRTEEPNVALVVAVDKSGSMGRCHCDDPRGIRQEGGVPKVDIAKQAILEAGSVLGPFDFVGVVAFDEKARWALETQQGVTPEALESAIAGIAAEGGTNILAGLDQAFQSLQAVDARIKHVILLTDGWTNAGGFDALVEQMHQQGITLSVVAAGRGSAAYLQRLAEEGGGRYYPAASLNDIPRIFLKETIRAVGRYIIEQRFRPVPAAPSPILTGFDPGALPPLRGYNGTSAKPAATVALLSPEGDPILAHWQYGLGRAVAWTSDLSGRWAAEWLGWDGFADFAAQLVSWTLPSPQDETLTAEVQLEGGQAIITVEAVDREGRPRNFLKTRAELIAPDGSTREVELPQVAAGRYRGQVEVSQSGAYLIQVRQFEGGTPVGTRTLGLAVPYSPEYRVLTPDTGLLKDLARTTGGRELTDPAQAFAHTLAAVERARPVWSWLLLLAALLFPLDVAVRRVLVTRRDLAEAWTALLRRLPRRRVAERPEPLLGHLFAAKQRAVERGSRGAGEPEGVQAGVQGGRGTREQGDKETREQGHRTSRRTGEAAFGSEVDVEAGADALERLRKAKERARRR